MSAWSVIIPPPAEKRLRVGGWRVILDVNVSEKIIIVSNVATRGGVYK